MLSKLLPVLRLPQSAHNGLECQRLQLEWLQIWQADFYKACGGLRCGATVALLGSGSCSGDQSMSQSNSEPLHSSSAIANFICRAMPHMKPNGVLLAALSMTASYDLLNADLQGCLCKVQPGSSRRRYVHVHCCQYHIRPGH